MNRRYFLNSGLAGASVLFASHTAGAIINSDGQSAAQSKAVVQKRRIIFRTFGGKLGIISEDGTGLEYLPLDVPGQLSWGCGPLFSDRLRIIITSSEEGKQWEGKVLSHIWIYDLQTKTLTEIATKNRPANFHVPCVLLPGDERMVTGPIIEGEQRVFTMNLDGSDKVAVTKKGEGFSYCVSLSPDAARLAFHTTGNGPYRIYVTGLDGSNRTLVAMHPDHLYFGTSWSPDGEWVLYQDCHYKIDPGHDWSDLCIGRPDGSEHRLITEGRRQWFGTSYGSPETRGSGSNMPEWSPDGRFVTFTRAKPDSRTAWQWAEDRPDTDHFNRDYKPEEARGGTDICLIDPMTRAETQITYNDPLVWDFRTIWSRDSQKIAFCRARVSQPSELWIMDADGINQQFLTRGPDNKGVDHPKFLL